MSTNSRRAEVTAYGVAALICIWYLIAETYKADARRGLIEAIITFVVNGIGVIILFSLLALVIYCGFRIASSATKQAERHRGFTWQNKVFHEGDLVLINREDPDYYENPMVIRPDDSPHTSEIDCDNGHTGVVVGGNNFGSLAVRWDAQRWREHSTRREISLHSFESSIHPDHMDLASSITSDNPLKLPNRKPPGGDQSIDLSNKDWLESLARETPLRDLVDLPHEVLTNAYFIGLLSNAAVAAIGSAHHQLPRAVVQNIAIQLLRRAEQDRSLANLIEASKTAEPPWTFDWQRAAGD